MRFARALASSTALAWFGVGCFALIDTSHYDTTPRSEGGADFPVDDEGKDGGVNDGAAISACDGALDPCPVCDLTLPFSPPTLIASVSDPVGNEFSARLSADLTTLYLHSTRDGGSDAIYIARRASVKDDFNFNTGGSLEVVHAFDSLLNAKFAMSTADELNVFFSATRTPPEDDASIGRDLFVSRRTSADGSIGPPELAGVGAIGHNDTPWISRNGKKMLFISNRDGGLFQRRLFETSLGADGGFVEPSPVDVEGQSIVDLPVLSEDGRTLYFAAPPAGQTQPYHIMIAHRIAADGPFTGPTLVTELNSSQFDWPTWLSADGCMILIVSSRGGTSDIFAAKKPLSIK